MEQTEILWTISAVEMLANGKKVLWGHAWGIFAFLEMLFPD